MSPATAATPAHVRSTSRFVLAAGLTFAATMLAALVALFVQERQQAIDAQLERNALYARVLEDHVTRSVDTAALSLATLAGTLSEQGLRGAAMNPTELARMLVSLPQLRAVTLLDLQGRVLGSSTPADVGRRIDLKQLGPLPAEGFDAIGSYVAGRGLSDAALGGASGAVPNTVGFIPLLRRVKGRDGELLLVALIHPEGLANQMRLTIRDPTSHAMLAGLDGRFYTDTANPRAGPPLKDHPAFRDYLPRIEHASYRGAGVEPGEQTVAFRVSRTRPLVVLVERPLASVLAAWYQATRLRMLVAGLAVLAAAVLTWAAASSLRAREQVRRSLGLAQARVARSEGELSVIVRSAQELLFRTDADGVLTFVNAHGPAAGGGLTDALIGTRFEALVKTEEQASVRSMFDAEGGVGVRSATVTFGAERDRARRFDVAVVALYDGWRVVGFAGSAVDITAREEAQARLTEQLAFSALLQEMSPLPTSLLDLEGRYVSVNRAWQEFTGRRREDVLGRVAGDYLKPEEALHHDARDRHLLDVGGRLRYETSYAHPDGSRRALLINKVTVPGRDGRPQGILCTFMDVTELHDAASATQEARDAAEESSRAKSEFIANISHELRTPLQAIIGFSELGTLPGRSPDKLVAMFPDILAAGQRMLALVNDLLDVSKLESSVGTIHLERTDLRPLLRAVSRELRPLLDAKQLVVEAGLPAAPLVATVDPLRFQQVLRNVLANAIKFAPHGTGIVLVAQVGADGGAHISVRDHGPGIPPQELERIFEAFVQSSKTKDGSGGTGLGLAICRKIIDVHGGSMSAENMPDRGSRFHIRLPPSRTSGETRPAELTD